MTGLATWFTSEARFIRRADAHSWPRFSSCLAVPVTTNASADQASSSTTSSRT